MMGLKLVKFFKYWFPVVLYGGVIFFLSSLPSSKIPKNLILPDYGLHFLEYIPFGILMYRAVNSSIKGSWVKIFFISLLLVALYAALDEFHQSFVAGRNVAFSDFLSDVIGALGGMLFLNRIEFLKKI